MQRDSLRRCLSLLFKTTSICTFILQLGFFPFARADEISIAPGGMTFHWIPVSSRLAQAMPRRIDNSGHLVLNPGMFVNYRNELGLFLSGGAIKDCYNNWAGYVLGGREWHLKSWMRWGVIGGFYGRQLPNVVERYPDGTVIILEDALNTISFVFSGHNGSSFGVVPMAGPYINFSFPIIKEKLEAEWITFGTAVILFSTAGLRYRF